MERQPRRAGVERAARGRVVSARTAQPEGFDGKVVVLVQLWMALEGAERADTFWRFAVQFTANLNQRSEKIEID